ncbi:MAG TPA: anti-sigma factor [Solirubrobacterales bacterium]|nr:anti-sigma factor [Solirubrobacterales bacterium]
MTGDHPHRDDLVAYALGALDPREEREVEAHAPSCARCTRELESLAPAVAVLGESVEQLEPPPELRERVMAEVRRDAAGAAEQVQAIPRRPQRAGWRGLLLRPAVGLAVLAIAVAGIAGYLVASNGGEEGGAASTVAVVPATPGIGGTLAVGEQSSMLDLHGLEPVSGREVYQVWVARGQNLRPSSNFIPDSGGRATTGVDGHLARGTKVMVTREPHAGRTTPTPPILLSATVQ